MITNNCHISVLHCTSVMTFALAIFCYHKNSLPVCFSEVGGLSDENPPSCTCDKIAGLNAPCHALL